MNPPSFTVRVSAVRSQSAKSRGGAIFTGIEVDDAGTRLDAKAHLVVKAPHWLLNTPVEVGQFWRVTGKAAAPGIQASRDDRDRQRHGDHAEGDDGQLRRTATASPTRAT